MCINVYYESKVLFLVVVWKGLFSAVFLCIFPGGCWSREGPDDHHPLLHRHSEDRGWCVSQGLRAVQWYTVSTRCSCFRWLKLTWVIGADDFFLSKPIFFDDHHSLIEYYVYAFKNIYVRLFHDLICVTFNWSVNITSQLPRLPGLAWRPCCFLQHHP